MGQQVDAIADSANKVISGVVDSSFGILRSFMPDPSKSPALSSNGRLTPSGGTPGSLPKTGFGLLRRESGFSIASLAASLPVSIPGRAKSNAGAAGEEGQQLVTVSRPSSVKSFKLKSGKQLRVKVGGSDDEEEDDEEEEESVDDSEQDRESEEGDGSNLSGDEEESAAEEGEDYVAGGSGDTRSIRSFESMLSASRRSAGDGKSKMSKARKSLSDRLASVSALAGRKVRLLLHELLPNPLMVSCSFRRLRHLPLAVHPFNLGQQQVARLLRHAQPRHLRFSARRVRVNCAYPLL